MGPGGPHLLPAHHPFVAVPLGPGREPGQVGSVAGLAEQLAPLVLVGAFKVSFWLSLLGSLGMILGAIYMLYLYRRVIFGTITRDDLKAILDLSPREIAVFAPLVILTFSSSGTPSKMRPITSMERGQMESWWG